MPEPLHELPALRGVATLAGRLGNVDLTSATGYSVDEIDSKSDYSAPAYGGYFTDQALSYFGVPGVAIPFERQIKKITQEIRASIPIGKRINWLLGAFYTDEESDMHLDYMATNPATGAGVGTLIFIGNVTNYNEHAAFTNVTLDITDRFDVQFGGRLGKISQTTPDALRYGPLSAVFFLSDPSIVAGHQIEDDTAFTYLFTPRFKISPDLMIYARVASGYRPGSPNSTCGIPGIPCQVDHDTTQNYELGFKGDVLDGALSFNASLYRINWQDIQLSLYNPTARLGYQDNYGRAKSLGVELSMEARPLNGLTIAGWAAWNDATLSKALPPPPIAGGEPAGSRLPFSSRWSGSISVDQEFPLARNMMGFVGAAASYVDDRAGSIAGAPLFLPGYLQMDLSGGLRYDSWTINAFVNNVTDKRGALAGFPGLSTAAVFTQPRTVGMSVSRAF